MMIFKANKIIIVVAFLCNITLIENSLNFILINLHTKAFYIQNNFFNIRNNTLV
jgi:hypothetical protein